MQYQPYPEYRNSNIEWLGDIPNHWDVMALHHVVRMRSGESITSTQIEKDGDFPVYGGNGIRGYFDEYTHDGSFVLIGRQGALCGNINYAEGRFWASEHAIVVKPDRDLITNWLGETLRAMDLNQYSVAAAQPGLSVESIGRLKIPFPPVSEQQTIARFLDYKTQQIDQLIAKKQTLIDKLNEQRIALITHAVTKGLNPDVEMKDSGVEWLGIVPKHWDVRRIKFALMLQRGHDLSADNREDGDVPVVSSAGISATHSTAIAKAPGIVTGRYGTIGKFVYVEEDYWPINTTLYSVDTYGNNVRFLWYMMHNFSEIFILNSKKSAVPGVDRNDIHPELTVIPPIEEQTQIVEYLDGKMARIDRMIELNQQTIDKLKEYRTALITAAVTGKIDVRKWQEEANHATP